MREENTRSAGEGENKQKKNGGEQGETERKEAQRERGRDTTLASSFKEMGRGGSFFPEPAVRPCGTAGSGGADERLPGAELALDVDVSVGFLGIGVGAAVECGAEVEAEPGGRAGSTVSRRSREEGEGEGRETG